MDRGGVRMVRSGGKLEFSIRKKGKWNRVSIYFLNLFFYLDEIGIENGMILKFLVRNIKELSWWSKEWGMLIIVFVINKF